MILGIVTLFEMEIIIRIGGIILAVLGFIAYAATCITLSQPKQGLRTILGVVLSGIFFGIAVGGILTLVAGELSDFERIFRWSILGFTLGMLTYLALWIRHGLLPDIFNILTKRVKNLRNNQADDD